MVQRRITTLAVALCATALVPATASADTTLGPDPLPVPTGSTTFGSCCVATWVITAYPGATLAAPTAGVITRWRVHEPPTQSGVMKPRVLRAAGGTSYTGVATGAEVPVGTSNTVKEYPTRLRIGAGEFFGVDANTAPSAAVAGTAFRGVFPAVADAATAAFNAGGATLAVNADMEPDTDSDGFGDETQDLALGATPGAADTEVGLIGSGTAVTLTNRDSAPMTIASVRVGGTAADDFLVSADACAGATLQPSETCAVRIRFAPTAVGARAATLSVRGTAGPLGQVLNGTDVALAGTGVAPSVGGTITAATAAPHLVAILLADSLTVRRGRGLRATVFSTVAGQASVRILRGSTVAATINRNVREGKTSLLLPTRRLRAGRYRVGLDVSGSGQTSSDTAVLVVRRRR